MEIRHHCVIEKAPPIRGDVEVVIIKWRCPVCGQKWRIMFHSSGWESRRIALNYPNLRNWRWQRAQKREL